jgi:hypothetical protein
MDHKTFGKWTAAPFRALIMPVLALVIATGVVLWLALFAVEKMTGYQTLPSVLAPARQTTKQKDDIAKVKCRAYTMLANMVGAKHKFQEDRIRILCTILNLEKTSNVCDVFSYQTELVVPGWGRRQTDMPLPFSGRNIYVPRRYIDYIETVDPDITETDRNAGIVLAEDVKEKKLCPQNWKATTIVRPERGKTVGNQQPNELAAIKNSEKMARQSVDGETEFEFYYPK